MAQEAGKLDLTLEYAKDLKDCDWFGKQDPYCVVTVGGRTLRSKTHIDGGRNPVWNETMSFNIINENDVAIVLKDKDILSDDIIGTARISLATARERGSDRVNMPVTVTGNKQKGYICVSLKFTPNSALKLQQGPYATGYAPSGTPMAPATAYQPPGAPAAFLPGYGYTGYAAPPPYGAPPAYAPSQSFHAPPPPAYTPAQSFHGQPPGYPPAPYPYAPQPHYSAPPPAGYPPASQPPSGYPPAQQSYGAPPSAFPPQQSSAPPAPSMYPPPPSNAPYGGQQHYPGQHGSMYPPPPGAFGMPPPH